MTDGGYVGMGILWTCLCLIGYLASCFEYHACDEPYCPHRNRRKP